MGRVSKRRGPLPDLVIRPFDDGWQRWEFTGGAARPVEDDGGEVRRILAVPARQALAVPLWIDGADGALAPETVKLELEVRGLLPRVQGMDGVSLHLLPQEGRTLAVAAVFPPELPADLPPADAFEVSARLLALPANAVTLWREGDDVVAAFTRGDDVVYWGTIDRSAGADEMRVWLGLLALHLRGEAVIDASPRVVSWVEGLPAGRVAPAGCEAVAETGDIVPGRPSMARAKLDWKPMGARLAEQQRVQRDRVRRIALGVAAAYIVFAAGLVLYFGGLRWQSMNLTSEARALTAEVGKFQPIARDWPAIAPTVTPDIYPLEILRGAVEGMPQKGVRLILFKIEDGQVTVNGEADTFQIATDYYNTLSASKAFAGFNLQADTPQMKANNFASFNITGTLPTP
jgi:hypothetical protein